MKISRERIGLVAVIFLSFIFIYLNFGKVILAPNNHLMNLNGDAIKNYYTPIYYIEHDNGYWFDGMLYPYGDHVVFTDNQPIISFFLNGINKVIPISSKTVGILNSLMLFSQILCCAVIYLILLHYNVKPWLAVVFASFIGLMAPPLERMLGHYALSYSFFIPLTWLALIKFYDQKDLRLLLGVALLSLTFTFIHVYYLAFTLLLAGFFLLGMLIQKSISIRKFIVSTGILLLVPVLAKVVLLITDPITDRPETPYGYFSFRSDIKSFFLPNEGPIYEFLRSTVGLSNLRWEGFSYVGLVTTVTTIIFIGYLVREYFSNRNLKPPELQGSLKVSLIVGILIFLYSMAFPFRLGLDFLWDFIGPFKQFRSTGRFAWVFYFILCVFSVVAINKAVDWLQFRKKYYLSILLIISIFFVWGFETYEYLNRMGNRVPDQMVISSFTKPIEERNQELHKLNIDPDDYQCLLGLPFYLGGSEGIYVPVQKNISIELMDFSFLSGLPMINSNMSRTSETRSYNVAKVSGSKWLPNPILSDMDSEKPILLLIAKGSELNKNEMYIRDKAKLLVERNDFMLYELRKEVLRQKFVVCDSLRSNEAEAIFSDFSRLKRLSDEKFRRDEWKTLKKIENIPGGELEISMWMDLIDVQNSWPAVVAIVIDNNGSEVMRKAYHSTHVKNLWNDWSRIEFDLMLPDEQAPYSIYLNTDCEGGEFQSFLLRIKGDEIIYREGDWCTINNIPVNRKAHNR